MRTRLLVVVLFAGMTFPALAHSPPPSNPPATLAHAIDIPSDDAFLLRNMPNDENESLMLGKARTRYESESRAVPSLHIGAFHIELGGTSEKMHFAHYTLEGVHVLGGNISGSIDSRSARIMLRWPMSN